MRMRKAILVAIAIPALAGATALAQNEAAPGANPAPAPAANQPADVPNPPANTANGPGLVANPPANAPVAQRLPAERPNFIEVKNGDLLTSNVVGLDIYNGQNAEIGKIQDVALDKSNRVVGYILSIGGLLGMGTRYVAVDPSAVSITYDANNKTWRASMNATKDQLKSAPEFKYRGEWTANRS